MQITLPELAQASARTSAPKSETLVLLVGAKIRGLSAAEIESFPDSASKEFVAYVRANAEGYTRSAETLSKARTVLLTNSHAHCNAGEPFILTFLSSVLFFQPMRRQVFQALEDARVANEAITPESFYAAYSLYGKNKKSLSAAYVPCLFNTTPRRIDAGNLSSKQCGSGGRARAWRTRYVDKPGRIASKLYDLIVGESKLGNTRGWVVRVRGQKVIASPSAHRYSFRTTSTRMQSFFGHDTKKHACDYVLEQIWVLYSERKVGASCGRKNCSWNVRRTRRDE